MRATPSGIQLSREDAHIVLGMIERGDRHHDIAAWFGVNQGRIAEIKAGELHPGISAAAQDQLPPPGPYPSGRAAAEAIRALTIAAEALEAARQAIGITLGQIRSGDI